MSVSLFNINSYLNKFVQNQTSQLHDKKKANIPVENKSGVDENIFAAASAMVSDFKSKDNTNNSGNSNKLSAMKIANMSTSEYLNYAYSNEAKSAYETSKNSDSSGIKLPMLVRYKTAVISTSGKSFMQVVAKIKAKFPRRSEEEIAAELMSKYATNEQIENVSKKYSNSDTKGTSLNFSA